MSKMNFSKGKFSKFISSKGFYVAIAVCLLGAGAATWLAVDRTITGIEDNNTQMIESENQWNDYPQLEEAEKKQSGEKKPAEVKPSTKPSPSSSSSSTASSSSASSQSSSKQAADSAPLATLEPSPSLAYVLPVSAGEVISPYSQGELVKNTTLNDWRTHDGVDLSAEDGSDILAAADGVIASISSDPLWGSIITIDHADGNQTIYCGLDSVLPVKPGDMVTMGQSIGKLDGVPCEITQPSHLHFAMKRDGKWVDPLGHIAKAVQ